MVATPSLRFLSLHCHGLMDFELTSCFGFCGNFKPDASFSWRMWWTSTSFCRLETGRLNWQTSCQMDRRRLSGLRPDFTILPDERVDRGTSNTFARDRARTLTSWNPSPTCSKTTYLHSESSLTEATCFAQHWTSDSLYRRCTWSGFGTSRHHRGKEQTPTSVLEDSVEITFLLD